MARGEIMKCVWLVCLVAVDVAPLVVDTRVGKEDGATPPVDSAITIGAETGLGGWFFQGDLDDVMYFTRVLTPQEIGTLAAN